MKAYRTALFAILMVHSLPAAAQSASAEVPTYTWSNEEGLATLDVKSCGFSVSKNSAFHVVDDAFTSGPVPEVPADQSFYDNRCGTRRKPFFCESVKIKGRSIVKDAEGKLYSEYQLANLTTVNKDLDEELDSSVWAFRNFEGYVKKSQLQPIENYVMKFTAELETQNDPGALPYTGMLLQAELSSTGYHVYNCGTRRFQVFALRAEQGGPVISRIGIHFDETKILRNLRVSPAASVMISQDPTPEAMKVVPVMPLPRPKFREQQDAGLTTPAVTTPEVPKVAPIPRDRPLSTLPFNEVICMPDNAQIAEVKNNDFEKTIYRLKNGTAVKIAQVFGTGPETKGEYVRIQIKSDGQFGWVLANQVAQAGQCNSIEEEPAADLMIVPTEPLAPGEYTVCTEQGDPVRTYDFDFTMWDKTDFLSSGEKVAVEDGTLFNKTEPNGHLYVKGKSSEGDDLVVAAKFLTQGKCANATTEQSVTLNFDGYVLPVYRPSGYSYLKKDVRPFQHSRYVYSDGTMITGYEKNWGIWGARRESGGRRHGATDMYQPLGAPRPNKDFSYRHFGGRFRALTKGRILRMPHEFYLGTSEMPVENEDGTISRYGEIYMGLIDNSKKSYEAGEPMGYIKWVGDYSVPPMLHLESYDSVAHPELIEHAKNKDNGLNSKNSKGQSTNGVLIDGVKTRRREGLIDRTKLIKDLEEKTFGNSEVTE